MRSDRSVPWPEEPIVASPSLCALASTCHFLRTVAFPLLFERVRITPLEQKDAHTLIQLKNHRVNDLLEMGEQGPLGHTRELSIHSHKEAWGLIMPMVKNLIHSLPKLRRLELIAVVISPDLLNALHSLSDLRHLKMMHCVYHSNLSPLFPSHSTLNLRSLLVRKKARQTNGSQPSIKPLAGPELTHLCMGRPTLDDWPIIPTLRHLRVETHTALGENEVIALLRMLEGCPELQVLQIPAFSDRAITCVPPLVHLRSIACDYNLLPTMISGRAIEMVDVECPPDPTEVPDLIATLSQSTMPIRALSTTRMDRVGIWRFQGVKRLVEAQPHLEQLEIRLDNQHVGNLVTLRVFCN